MVDTLTRKIVELVVRARGLDETGRRSSRVLRQIERDATVTQGALGRLSGGFGVLTRAVPQLGAVLSVAGVAAFTKSTLDAADALQKTSDRIGIGVEDLQELRFAFETTAGVTERTADTALQRFSRRLGEATRGTGQLADVLEENSIALRDADGAARPVVDVLADYADVVARAESDQEALSLAVRAFDIEGAAMVTTLRQGGQALREMGRDARELGSFLTEGTTRGAEALNDALRVVSERTLGRFQRSIAEATVAAARFFGVLDGAGVVAEFGGIESAEQRLAEIGDRIIATQDRITRRRELTGRETRADAKDAAILDELQAEYVRVADAIDTYNGSLERIDATAARVAAGLATGGGTDSVAGAARDAAQGVSELEVEGRRVFEATRTPLERYQRSLGELRELLAAGAVDHDTFGRAVEQAEQRLEDATATTERFARETSELERVGDRAFSRLGDAVGAFATRGKADFRSFVDAVIADFARLLSRRFTDPLIDGLGGLFTDTLGGFVGGFFGGGVTAGARGLAAAGYPGLSALSGSVVDRPTLIPGGPSSRVMRYARGGALIGEAGHEAVLPLERGPDGRLGVSANGSGAGDIVIHQYNDFRGADPSVMGELDARLRRLKTETIAEVRALAQRGRMRGQGFS